MDHRELSNVADAQPVQLDELLCEDAAAPDQLLIQPQEGIEQHINKNRYGDIKTCPLYKELGGLVMNSIQEKVEQGVAVFEEKIREEPKIISPALARARARREKARAAEVSSVDTEDSLHEVDSGTADLAASTEEITYLVEARQELQKRIDEIQIYDDQTEVKDALYSLDTPKALPDKPTPTHSLEPAAVTTAMDRNASVSLEPEESVPQTEEDVYSDMASAEFVIDHEGHYKVEPAESTVIVQREILLTEAVPEIHNDEADREEIEIIRDDIKSDDDEMRTTEDTDVSFVEQIPTGAEDPSNEQISFEYDVTDVSGEVAMAAVSERVAVFFESSAELGMVENDVRETIIKQIHDALTDIPHGVYTPETIDSITQAVLEILQTDQSREVDFDTIHTFVQQLTEELLSEQIRQENLNVLNLIGTNEHKFHASWRSIAKQLTESTDHRRMSRFIMMNLLLSRA